MAANHIILKVLTPAGIAFEAHATSVCLPTTNGEITILPEHCRYSGLLGVGILTYESADSNPSKKVVVSGGFCNFSNEILTILADTVATKESIDIAALGAQEIIAVKELSEANGFESDWDVKQQKLQSIEAMKSLAL